MEPSKSQAIKFVISEVFRFAGIILAIMGWMFFAVFMMFKHQSVVIYGTNIPELAEQLDEVWHSRSSFVDAYEEGFRLKYQGEWKNGVADSGQEERTSHGTDPGVDESGS